MPGGMTTRVRIHRYSYDEDDAVGGAMPTGTVLHSNVHARIEANPEDQLLLQQGLETIRTFNAIVGVQYSSMDKYNPNNYMRLSMIRSVRSHGVQ
jgi:hypothetical protein